MSLNKNLVQFRQLGRVKTKTGLSLDSWGTFAAHFANIRRTRATLFTKFAGHFLHIKLHLIVASYQDGHGDFDYDDEESDIAISSDEE